MKGFPGNILWAGVSKGSPSPFSRGKGHVGSLGERGRGLPGLYCGLVSVWVISLPSPEDKSMLEVSENEEGIFRYYTVGWCQ